MTTYTTKDGDMLDAIVWKHYGRQDQQSVEQVLDANPSLAEVGATLPAGVAIVLPILTKPETVRGVKLWD
jgi:phage tail protein X